ncbi:molybdenum cofactor biosynthesis protein MoaE [Pseudoalteromonas sp. C2R02]|uniref:molybdenum cofactor biosynthesis protein MoaE n=1 Tax=Pseudoalteromonas sp. C2R02 TaxID=2841565 RepID=UPI001C08E5E2|nr:molybdenum cofactor biosynthesis protein MoaE [Pseudoalteromonas sp. C2R02]MBU2970696.1 molybdenum cofactor biosynthesis protein MoaE [Pseudoalteromonas sp. C2R02]
MISVQEADFNLSTQYEMLRAKDNTDGAIVTFIGLVRDFNQGHDVTGLFLEHYPAMTVKSLEKISERAKERFKVNQLDIVHRVGQLALGDQIVYVGVSSPHREEAFACAQFVMDYLKKEAPFWKKETRKDQQQDVWVETNQKDKEALKKWQ